MGFLVRCPRWCRAAWEIPNSKIPNPKKITNPKLQITKREGRRAGGAAAAAAAELEPSAVAVLPEVVVLKQNAKLAVRPIKNMLGDLRLQIYAAWKKDRETLRMVNFIEVLRDIGVQRE